jgi:methionyl aminopeptidase
VKQHVQPAPERYARETDATGRPIRLHGPDGFEGLRRAGRLAAATLDHARRVIRPGMTTAELDRECEIFMRDHGAVPATIGYHGYRHASCISHNHIVTHGIPSDRVRLMPGDIVNVDVTPLVDGWHGDSSRTFFVGEPTREALRLVHAAYEAMMAGVAASRPGNRMGDVGHAIESVARRERFTVVREFCGHGIGQVFHDAPEVLNFGQPGTGVRLEAGMVFTVEPMLNAGRAAVRVLGDGWTAQTWDRSWSAQFEHMIGLTLSGPEIFTLSPAGWDGPQVALG